MQVVILSPEKEIFRGQATAVKVPGSGGQFEILKNHAPIVSALSRGTVKVKQENKEALSIEVEGGFVEVLNNEVSLLVTGVKNQ
jgi:F-type H+-transporting ATPase subunit epsilon